MYVHVIPKVNTHMHNNSPFHKMLHLYNKLHRTDKIDIYGTSENKFRDSYMSKWYIDL